MAGRTLGLKADMENYLLWDWGGFGWEGLGPWDPWDLGNQRSQGHSKDKLGGHKTITENNWESTRLGRRAHRVPVNNYHTINPTLAATCARLGAQMPNTTPRDIRKR